ncbi:MAG: hypothetical protein IJZ46_04165 [Bacilli bacterium]|nr:hypothetical protein [Bacilli bacterium]
MEKERIIPLKNYILLAVVLLVTIILVIYFYMWYGKYEESILTTPIMDKYMQVINYNELDEYLVENKNPVIYSSVLNDEEIRTFEIKFKKFISDNSLKNNILYLDLTSVINDNKIIKSLKEKYKLEDKDITNLPLIMTFRDGKIISIYDIKEDNYDLEKLKNYLRKEGVLND